MVKRPLASFVALTATAVLATGCMSFQWEERKERVPDGFSVGTPAPPPPAIENVAPASTTSGKPSKPRAAIVKRKGTLITLKWHPPASTGGAPVKYQARISKPDSMHRFTKWKKATKKRKAKFRTIMTAKYKVQVRAKNKHGVSKPTSTISRRIADPVKPETTTPAPATNTFTLSFG